MKMLTSDDYNFRKTVEECNGVGLRIAEKLGLSPQAVSARLNSAKHLYWWKQFKRAKNRAPVVNKAAENEETFTPSNEGAEEIINQTNLKLRSLVIKHRGKLNLVADELGIPKGVDFVEEYLNSDHNRGWWALCRFNPENDFEKEDTEESAQETLPLTASGADWVEMLTAPLDEDADGISEDKNEIALLREQISVLQEEMAKYKQVISLYEAAHKMVSTQTRT